MPTTTDLWPDIVGQEKAKQKLNFYHEGFRATNVIPKPHVLLRLKGAAKTLLAKALAKNLIKKDEFQTQAIP